MTAAIKGESGDEAWTDYIMSEKFGINWAEMNTQRKEDFKLILQIINNLNKNNG